jgi:hypothetical protein
MQLMFTKSKLICELQNALLEDITRFSLFIKSFLEWNKRKDSYVGYAPTFVGDLNDYN